LYRSSNFRCSCRCRPKTRYLFIPPRCSIFLHQGGIVLNIDHMQSDCYSLTRIGFQRSSMNTLKHPCSQIFFISPTACSTNRCGRRPLVSQGLHPYQSSTHSRVHHVINQPQATSSLVGGFCTQSCFSTYYLNDDKAVRSTSRL